MSRETVAKIVKCFVNRVNQTWVRIIRLKLCNLFLTYATKILIETCKHQPNAISHSSYSKSLVETCKTNFELNNRSYLNESDL